MSLRVQPYLPIGPKSGGARKAIAWYKSVFDATIKCAFDHGGKIAHSELAFGNTVIMISDEFEGYCKSPEKYGGSSVALNIEFPVGKSKAVFDKAVAEGGKINSAWQLMPYGYDSGTVEDPFGFSWEICENSKKWSYEEVRKNMKMTSVMEEF